MRNAIPYDVLPESQQPQKSPFRMPQAADPRTLAAAVGAPGWMPSRPPDLFFGPLLTSGGAGTYPAPTPSNTQTTAYVAGSDIYTFPYRAAGKVFFTMLGRNYACSAAVIGEYTIWTAAHCVNNGRGVFHSNWVFIPGFDNYTTIHPGPWLAAFMVTSLEFSRKMDLTYDYAIVGLRPPFGVTRSMRSYTGALGFAWNMPRAQNWKLLGYPMIYFDGLHMVYSDSTYWVDNPTYNPPSVGVGSRIKSGGSGGPWILNFGLNQAGQTNYLNGVNSYISPTGDEVYSPYFDDRAKGLWDCSQNSVPGLDWGCFQSSASRNLTLSYTPGSDPAAPNTPFSYQINIYNPGPDAATGVMFSDTSYLSFVRADLPGGSCVTAGATATCTLDSLPAGATVSATMVLSTPGSSAVMNSAQVTFDQQEKWEAQETFVTAVNCATQLTVTSAADSGSGSLREALANACSSGAVIDFDPSLSGETIHLASQLDVQGTQLTIDGSALAIPLTLSGEGNVRVLNAPTASLILNSLIITQGQTSGNGGGVLGSSLTLKNSSVTASHAASGGGIYLVGSLNLVNSSVTGNTATGLGGGIYYGTNLGSAAITGSTLAGNSAASGGGVYFLSSQTPVVTNSTLAGNNASVDGGGIYNQDGPITLTNVTLSDNSASGRGGGLFITDLGLNQAILNFSNTIIANSTSGGDCVIDSGSGISTNLNNLVGDGSCSTGGSNFLSGAPLLGPLADNGGPTQTLALLAGSPAIDAGDQSSCPASDQRGVLRPQGAACDLGALEAAPTDTVAPLLTLPENIVASAETLTGARVDFTVTATDAVDASPVVFCAPASGSTFPLGSTTVDCTATDLSGNQSSGSFTVAVVLYTSNVRYAKPSATGAGDCSSWANACGLQTALAAASVRGEIWAANGTYKPTTGTDRAATFLLPKASIYGGFAGTETARSQRDWTTHLSILSGDLLGNDNSNLETTEPTRADNSYHVVTGSEDATLDGFTVTGGNADGSACPEGCGGGVSDNFNAGGLYSNGLKLANLTLRANSANQGGGLYQAKWNWSLTNLTVSNNFAADKGGGIYLTDSQLSLTQSTISNNSATVGGGGIYNGIRGTLTVTQSTLSANSSDYGGGIENTQTLTLTDSTVSGNTAASDGGGIENSGDLSLTNSTLTSNTASGFGGGIDNYDVGSVTLTNVTLAGNGAQAGGNLYSNNTLDYANTILSNASAGVDCLNDGGTIGTNSHNLVSDGSCSDGGINFLTGDPKLGPLANSGGFTQTLSLLSGSPAIDAASPALCPATDQRGVTRPVGAVCDIGAVEDDQVPTVDLVRSSPEDGALLAQGLSRLKVVFSKDVLHNGSATAANNPINYLLVSAGPNGVFDTQTCKAGLQTDDLPIGIYLINYDSASFTATLAVNGAVPLPEGSYRLWICGTTSITDLYGLKLNYGLTDATLSFRVDGTADKSDGKAKAGTVKAKTLPATGFAPNQVTLLPEQPLEAVYAAYDDLVLEIPALKVNTSIVGVPETADGWDVTWLGNQAGWLNGTAFPTWNGNSVITGHVWDANNQPGIFVNLKQLKYGDQVKIHAWGQVYTYEVRETRTVSPASGNAVLKHEDQAWITLITCEDFRQLSTQYSYRRIVRAILLSVTAEK
jgi:LPXTG-site transpeptidase (sortase) family protein